MTAAYLHIVILENGTILIVQHTRLGADVGEFVAIHRDDLNVDLPHIGIVDKTVAGNVHKKGRVFAEGVLRSLDADDDCVLRRDDVIPLCGKRACAEGSGRLIISVEVKKGVRTFSWTPLSS